MLAEKEAGNMPVWRTDRISEYVCSWRCLLEEFLRAIEEAFAQWSVLLTAKCGELFELAALLPIKT